MDLSAYLLNGIVDATAPPNESESAARSRGDAIVEMVCAFDPRDAMETMIACHCVMLQFLLNAAMRDAGNIQLEPELVAKNRAGAIAVSRALHQWVTKFEKVQKRNETRAAEAAKAQLAAIPALAIPPSIPAEAAKSTHAPAMPEPVPPRTDRPATHSPRPNPLAVIPVGLPLVPGAVSNVQPSLEPGARRMTA